MRSFAPLRRPSCARICRNSWWAIPCEHVKVVEGSRERLQAFEGVVIARRNGSARETFTVRRTSYGVGVERTFPLHSPRLDHIEVIRRGKVRRAKLYYLRERSGKAAKVKDK